MRPADYTPQQIIDAGLALQAEGRRVTGFALRQSIGGGNAPRLTQIWREYLAAQSGRPTDTVSELPVEVAERLAQVSELLGTQLVELVVDINHRAVVASERRVAEVLRVAADQREQAEGELLDASQAVEDLEQQVDIVNESLAAARGIGERLTEEKHALALELVQVKERLAALEKSSKADQYAAIERDRSAVAREQQLRSELEAAQLLERDARERLAQAMGAHTALEKQHKEDAQTCKELRHELRDVREKQTRTSAKADSNAEQLAEARRALGEAQQALKSAQDDAKKGLKLAAEAADRERAALDQIKALTEAASGKGVRSPG